MKAFALAMLLSSAGYVFVWGCIYSKKNLSWVVDNCNTWGQWKEWPWWMQLTCVLIVANMAMITSFIL